MSNIDIVRLERFLLFDLGVSLHPPGKPIGSSSFNLKFLKCRSIFIFPNFIIKVLKIF